MGNVRVSNHPTSLSFEIEEGTVHSKRNQTALEKVDPVAESLSLGKKNPISTEDQALANASAQLRRLEQLLKDMEPQELSLQELQQTALLIQLYIGAVMHTLDIAEQADYRERAEEQLKKLQKAIMSWTSNGGQLAQAGTNIAVGLVGTSFSVVGGNDAARALGETVFKAGGMVTGAEANVTKISENWNESAKQLASSHKQTSETLSQSARSDDQKEVEQMRSLKQQMEQAVRELHNLISEMTRR